MAVDIDQHQLLSMQETADLLSVSYITVRRLVASGTLPSRKIGRLRKIWREDLQAFIEGRSIRG